MTTENYKISIKELAEDDRPREKMMLKGRTALSDAELIAILIGSGNRKESAVQLSQRILQEQKNDLNQLARLSIKDLQKFNGIGEAKAITICAALELGRRRKEQDAPKKIAINSSKDVYNALRPKLQDLPHEEFWVILLSRSNKILDMQLVGRGGITGTVADVRVILKLALENSASSIIVSHNHPSGNLKPSPQDIQLTKKIKEASTIMDITLLDHLIFTDEGFLSFADEGML